MSARHVNVSTTHVINGSIETSKLHDLRQRARAILVMAESGGW